MQGNIQNTRKKRAHTPAYVSPKQLVIEGFESPFERKLNPKNRWFVLANILPWDELSSLYWKYFPEKSMGRPTLNPRIVLGSLIIKHICDLDDRETVDQISENIYMQYFLGYSSFNDAAPFDASLFVEFRKRLGLEQINAINERILQIKMDIENKKDKVQDDKKDKVEDPPTHKGSLIVDATACPQDIAYPTDLDLLNESREKSEQLIDVIYDSCELKRKPRTYREKARKDYLKTAQKKNKTRKEIRQAIKKQLNYLKRNLATIEKLFKLIKINPLDKRQYKYLLVIHSVYEQQQEMFNENKHSVDNRIVNIHQPHVRPIVRGKAKDKVEFGSKINVALVDGFSFIDDFSWEAFNEGQRLQDSIKKYQQRYGYLPEEVLADKIYCNRDNRAYLKELNIKLKAKPLGRSTKVALSNQVSLGERNPIKESLAKLKQDMV